MLGRGGMVDVGGGVVAASGTRLNFGCGWPVVVSWAEIEPTPATKITTTALRTMTGRINFLLLKNPNQVARQTNTWLRLTSFQRPNP
jgi:hypothetical protein